MISFYDYLNIAFYVLFIVGVGVYYSRRNKNTSDYFRGGGVMPWWITGAAAWMGSFSAWTFTGAAGKIYETGPYVLCLYFAGLPALIVVLVYTCFRFRRMRVVTPLEAVRMRFGPGSQQFYTWIRLPFLLFFGGVSLTSVSVFMAAVFAVDTSTMIVSLGLIVLVVSMLGGTFAVAASDFVQMFLVVTVTIVVSFLALRQPEVGGIAGMLDKVPPQHFQWADIARPEFIFLWVLALTANNIFGQNSMENSAKFLMTRSDRHARLTMIIPIVGTILGPVIWIIPPMVAAVTHSDLGKMFPQLSYPHEAAFLATALDVLPNGMLGLLICGIFAATLTGMDASLNQGAGIFVRNFYLPVINPNCPEKKLLLTSKACTAVFGLIIITIALFFSSYRTLGLFDLLNQLGVSLWLPLAIPLALGLFFKRTPSWSTWSTVAIGFVTAFIVKFFLKPSMLSWIPGLEGPYLPEEEITFTLFATVAVVGGICSAWFFFTSLFYGNASAEYKASVEEFFTQVRTPLLQDKDVTENTTIESSIGRLCIIYGTFVMMLLAIPNSLIGRLSFVFCGGIMLTTGLLLVWHYRKKTTSRP